MLHGSKLLPNVGLRLSPRFVVEPATLEHLTTGSRTFILHAIYTPDHLIDTNTGDEHER